MFSGKPADFSECCFAMEEVVVVVPLNDQVRFVVSYLAADARIFMTTYSACGHPRPNDWSSLRKELQAAFSPEFEKASHRCRLQKIRSHRRYIQRRLFFARVTSTTAATRFLADLPIPIESVRTDVYQRL